MRSLGIVPIVEGHGEQECVRILLTRTVGQLLGGPYPEVLSPIRVSRSKLVGKPKELERAVSLAALKLRQRSMGFDHGLVLLLLDADDDLPCMLAPRLLARVERPDVDTICVLANPEYETWFVAAARSLPEYLELGEQDERMIADPEAHGLKKAWVERRFLGGTYSETIDQPRLTARMDLASCRSACRSFDKLCRELERRLACP